MVLLPETFDVNFLQELIESVKVEKKEVEQKPYSERLSSEQRNYIMKAKENNVSFKLLTKRFNKKYGTEFSKQQIVSKYHYFKRS